MDSESEDDQPAWPAGTGLAAQYHAHRQLLREEDAYRRRYLLMAFTPTAFMGLNMATSAIVRHLGIAAGVSYSLLLLASMSWLIIKSGLFVHRRIVAVLRGRAPTPIAS